MSSAGSTFCSAGCAAPIKIPAPGVVEELMPLIERIRSAWPDVEIVLRADSGFARDKTMAWCEREESYYVFGLSRNPRLQEMLGRAMARSRRRHVATGRTMRRFRQFRYRTLDSWSKSRRVVGKAEHLARGANPRFVVTSLARSRIGGQDLYEKLYCPRDQVPYCTSSGICDKSVFGLRLAA
jgi:hypothetical protein